MSESLFRIHEFDIPYDKYNEPIYLIPFGDIHRFAPLCHEEHWFEFLDWAKKKQRCYFLGMGDYDDMFSGTERMAMAGAHLHESSRKSLDDYYTERTMKLIKELKFMRGKLIGLIEGNHHANLSCGMTTSQLMAQELGCTYLGVSTFIRLHFKKNNHESRSKLDIWAHHGRGGSSLIGGSLNTVQKMSDSANADIYLMGHDHKKSVGMKSVLQLTHGSKLGTLKLHHKKLIFGRTGSFLKGYEHNSDSYVAQAALSPTDLGVIKIEMTPRRTSESSFGKRISDIVYVDIHASI